VTTFVAMLRGVNVGGRNRVSMADLRGLLVAGGYDPVVTYVQSGNVVFGSRTRRAADVARAVEQMIAEDLGLDVTVVLRTPAELTRVVDTNPFLGRGADLTKLHVTFLAGAGPAAAVRRAADAIDPHAYAPDEFHIAGHEVFLRCPAGYGKTKLNNTFWEKRLGVPATTRNWATVTKLLELASAT
jgi:uncharacterized protein (DUF1697 family)